MSSIRKKPQPFKVPVAPGDWHCQKKAISSSTVPATIVFDSPFDCCFRGETAALPSLDLALAF